VNEPVSAVDEVLGLLNSKFNSVIPHFLLVILNVFQGFKDLLRHCSLSEFKHFFEPVVAQDRHQTGNDELSDASVPAVFDPLVEQFVVEEKLGDDEVSSSIHLLLQELDIVISAFGF